MPIRLERCPKQAALNALAQGEVDCAFPSNLGGYDGERRDIVMTTPLMSTDIYAVVRQRTFGDFLEDNMGVVGACLGAVLLVITLLMLRSMRSERLAKELIAAIEFDALTGLYNRDYFFQYANRMRREHPDTPMDATYYYRIDPTVSDSVKGFWYTNLDGEGFVEHEVTDITLYDTNDTSQLVWFTVPKNEGEPVWLPPYITDNLDKRVISYNVPIYWRGKFVGVVGIEIDYSTMASQVESIRLYNNGYAFLSDGKGDLFLHPRIDVSQYDSEEVPKLPGVALTKSTFVQYNYGGIEKKAAWLPLSNGMHLYVTVPVAEAEGDWQRLIRQTIIYAIVILVVTSALTMIYTKRITKPLEELTDAADQVDRGNYDISLEYDKDDEVGRLTSTFRRLTNHMKDHISELNKRAYVDALTHVRNKGACSCTRTSAFASRADSSRFTRVG